MGQKGEPGMDGVRGPPGPPGYQGERGLSGSKGERGPYVNIKYYPLKYNCFSKVFLYIIVLHVIYLINPGCSWHIRSKRRKRKHGSWI